MSTLPSGETAKGGNSKEKITLSSENLPDHKHTGSIKNLGHTHNITPHVHDILTAYSGKRQIREEGNNSGKYLPRLLGPHGVQNSNVYDLTDTTQGPELLGEKVMSYEVDKTLEAKFDDINPPKLEMDLSGGPEEGPKEIEINLDPEYYILAYIMKTKE